MAQEIQTTARLEARLPNDVHALLKRAAEIEGRSLTDFVVSAAREARLRLGEALSLEWAQVKLEPAQGAKFGYLTVSSGKAKSKKSRNVPLSKRSVAMLRNHGPAAKGYVFHRADGSPWPNSHLGQQHARMRTLLKMPTDFVLHSLRHTFGTRPGESGADAFTIMRLMGHSTVTVSQRYVHPSPEAFELAYERMTAMNLRRLPTNSPTVTGGDVAVAS